MNNATTAWTIFAGYQVAQLGSQLESPDQLTRLSAESMMGVAKAELARALNTVGLLEACLALDSTCI